MKMQIGIGSVDAVQTSGACRNSIFMLRVIEERLSSNSGEAAAAGRLSGLAVFDIQRGNNHLGALGWLKPDGSFWSDDMNSYNHYAYGAIGDWMYRTIAGLDMDETKPAYKRIHIEPKFAGAKMTFAKASHQSMYGTILSAWQVNGKQIEVEVHIPANTTAQVVLSGAAVEGLREGNQVLALVDGIINYREGKEGVHLEIGSGAYRFIYQNQDIAGIVFNENTILMDVLNHAEARKLLIKHFPNFENEQNIQFIKMMTLEKLAESPFAKATSEQINALVEELALIN